MRIQMPDGVSYAVYIEGEGEPVVLLHGFTGNRLTWTNVVDSLKQQYMTIAIELLGHGESDCPIQAERYSIEHTKQDILYILNTLKLESILLVGYSMGGRIALAFSLAYPERVSSLVLESASPGLAINEERVARASSDDQLALNIEQQGLSWFASYWGSIPLFATQKRLPIDVQEKLHLARLNNSSLGLANSLRGIGTGRQPSYWADLHHLHMKVTFIVGVEDVKYVTIAKQMNKHVPQATVVQIEQAGHNVHLEQPELYTTQLKHALH